MFKRFRSVFGALGTCPDLPGGKLSRNHQEALPKLQQTVARGLASQPLGAVESGERGRSLRRTM